LYKEEIEMALDVYVGGFARYYSREWENVVQKWSRESGQEYKLISPGGSQELPDWDEVAEATELWRESINKGLGQNLSAPILWSESRQTPYFTDRPGYEGYGALVLLAAYAELGMAPPEKYKEKWFDDKVYQEASIPKQGQKYRAIVSGSLWLPGDFMFSFNLEDLTGEKAHICSNSALHEALVELNKSSLKIDEKRIQDVLKAGFDGNPSLLEFATFGFAVIWELCNRSLENNLPIILDN
jgi:uncharacterized protein YozE (UPF0346 family)